MINQQNQQQDPETKQNFEVEINIPNEVEVINNIERLKKEKESLEMEISLIENKKQTNMEKASKILNSRREYEDKFIQRFFSALKRKQNGLEEPNVDFNIKLKLLESEVATQDDPAIQGLMQIDKNHQKKKTADFLIADEYLTQETCPESSGGITKGLIDTLFEELEGIKKSSDDHQVYSKQKLLSSLMNHYSPTEHDFLYPIKEEATQDEGEGGYF